jgi:hypothetical protein
LLPEREREMMMQMREDFSYSFSSIRARCRRAATANTAGGKDVFHMHVFNAFFAVIGGPLTRYIMYRSDLIIEAHSFLSQIHSNFIKLSAII